MSILCRFLLSITIIFPTIACGAHQAHSRGGVSISLEDSHGRPLNTYYYRGQTYVLGEFGRRYVIRVSNRTAQRMEVVISVDGRDVISGRSGDFKSQRGYVVHPFDTLSVDGFRRSMNSIAAFRFTSRGDSYAGRMGAPENIGVIGVAVFPERSKSIAQKKPRRKKRTVFSNLPSISDKSSTSQESVSPQGHGLRSSRTRGLAPRVRPNHSRYNLGTQYGETEKSEAINVTFVRANPKRPKHILTLHYDDHPGLVSRGVLSGSNQSSYPKPFPQNSFAPPPP